MPKRLGRLSQRQINKFWSAAVVHRRPGFSYVVGGRHSDRSIITMHLPKFAHLPRPDDVDVYERKSGTRTWRPVP